MSGNLVGHVQLEAAVGINVLPKVRRQCSQVRLGRLMTRGELASNRSEDHEVTILSLHLLQNCMVYVNTLPLRQVLAQPHWAGQLPHSIVR